jgi:hypothetical protein
MSIVGYRERDGREMKVWGPNGFERSYTLVGSASLKYVCSIIDGEVLVNRTAYMNFKSATDRLFSRIDHKDLAKALGVSVASIRQARLKPDALAHRSPPLGWENALVRLANERVRHFRELVEEIRGSSKTGHSSQRDG